MPSFQSIDGAGRSGSVVGGTTPPPTDPPPPPPPLCRAFLFAHAPPPQRSGASGALRDSWAHLSMLRALIPSQQLADAASQRTLPRPPLATDRHPGPAHSAAPTLHHMRARGRGAGGAEEEGRGERGRRARVVAVSHQPASGPELGWSPGRCGSVRYPIYRAVVLVLVGPYYYGGR